MSDQPQTLGVALVGHSFMGAVHSHAWRTVDHVGTPALRTRRAVLVGRDEQRTALAAEQFGWESASADWREAVERDDVHVVDVCTPGDSHAEIAIAALRAGKHVICEKTLASSVEEARSMVAAADRARARGVHAMVGFNYRRVPAVALARRLVDQGRIGEVRHVRGA